MSLTSTSSVQPGGAAKALWARAGLWRLSVMFAGLLTLLFVLFPPERNAEAPAAGPLPAQAATYVPQAPAPTLPQVPPVSKATRAEQAPPHSTVAPQPVQKSVRPADPAPRNADIAIANAGGNSPRDVSGLEGALMGRTYSGTVLLNGYKLPLPPGNWAMLANTSITMPTATGMAYFLGRIEHKRLVGAIRVTAMRSKAYPGAGFPEFKRCKLDEPNNSYTFVEAVVPQDHQACWFIHNYYTPPWQQWADRGIKLNVIDRAAAGDMAAKGVMYPQDLIGVEFDRSEKWGFLQLAYLFSPEAEGVNAGTAVSFRDADWHAGNVKRFPEKVAYLAKLENWGRTFWPQIKTAFADTEPVGQPVTPADTAQVSPVPSAPMPRGVVSSGLVSPLDIRMGDNVATVKTVLKATQEPQAMERPRGLPDTAPDMTAGKTFMHVVDKGVWVFFDPAGKVYSVRLDAPFSGDIKGIRLGDGLSKIASVFGEPISKPSTFGNMLAYRYALDETRHVRFDLSGDAVRQIFITR